MVRVRGLSGLDILKRLMSLPISFETGTPQVCSNTAKPEEGQTKALMNVFHLTPTELLFCWDDKAEWSVTTLLRSYC